MSEDVIMDYARGEEKPPKLIGCRHAVREDIPRIKELICDWSSGTFADNDRLPVIFEKSCLSIVQENEVQKIVSAIFLCNYPNVPVLPQSEWPIWIKKLYDLEYTTEMNTLFVHYLVWDERYEEDFLKALLTATFYAAALCTHVVLVQPPTVPQADVIRKIMTRIPPKNVPTEAEAQVLYVSDQCQLIPETKFRLVVEEDNDDVVEILDIRYKNLKEFYGDYYISEMVRHPVDTRSVLVAESENYLVGVMALNRSVDLDLLNDLFHLEAFDKLRKSSNAELVSTDKDIGIAKKNTNVDETGEDKSIILDDRDASEYEYCESVQTLEEEEKDTREGNVFALELLGHRRLIYGLKCQNFLCAGFECYPDLDYCVNLIPTDQRHFPLLDNFVRVPLKKNKDHRAMLYVTHRAVLQGVLRVRDARSIDEEEVAGLLNEVPDGRDVALEFAGAVNSGGESANDRRCFVFTCDGGIVGFAIVCAETDVDRLRRAYHLEELVPRLSTKTGEALNFGRLVRLVLMPVFCARLGFFLGEIMRQAELPIICHRAVFDRDMSEIDVSPLLSVMQPVEPRLRNWPKFQRYYQKEFKDSPFDHLFSLFVATPRMTLMTKNNIDIKIVVVGGSDCGLAFIDALALGFKYNNVQFGKITLISVNGLPYEHLSEYSVRIMTPFRGRYCHIYRKLTPTKINYNIIKGTVVAIDRENKRVQIENSDSISYDYLVLTCGLMFQKPRLKRDSYDEEDEDSKIPLNCFLINDDVSAKKFVDYVTETTKNFTVKKSIVFHGCNIECYCALGALLETGLDGSWITLIEPKPIIDDAFKDDCEIKETLKKTIATKGIKVMSEYDLIDWTLDESDICMIKSLSIENEAANRLLLDCDALLSFHNRLPCRKTFIAISQASLVFDGLLVIDADFRTNDPWIFAAGTMTKYTRKLMCGTRSVTEHRHYDSLEIGDKLAERFISIIMADKDDSEIDNERAHLYIKTKKLELKIPDTVFRMPKVTCCILPGGYRYLHVRKPSTRICSEHYDVNEADAEDDVFTTGSCTADIGYFRLRLNQFRTVESATCFSKKDFDIQNMIALYGRHEAMFNDLRARYLNSEITDFYAYFNEPWAAALFADDFDEFKKKCKYFCANVTDPDECKNNTAVELANTVKMYNERGEITEAARDKIIAEYLEKSCYLQEIENGLIDYLESHEDELPMYLTPSKERGIRREMDYDEETLAYVHPDYGDEFGDDKRAEPAKTTL